MTNEDLAKLEEPEQGLEEYRWDWEICEVWEQKFWWIIEHDSELSLLWNELKNDEITHDGED